MKALRIIEGSTFGPEVVRAATTAFESAWEEIASRFGADMHEEARERLASSIILASRSDTTDADALSRVGLDAMIRSYPRYFPSLPKDSSGTED